MAECKDKCGSRGVTWCLVAMCSFALLIWAKLRLVTGVPRTAYAVPEDKPQEPKPEVKPQAPDSVKAPSQQP
jgi:hypothetical protein